MTGAVTPDWLLDAWRRCRRVTLVVTYAIGALGLGACVVYWQQRGAWVRMAGSIWFTLVMMLGAVIFAFRWDE